MSSEARPVAAVRSLIADRRRDPAVAADMRSTQRSRLSIVLRQVFLPAFALALLFSVSQDALGTTEQFRPNLAINIPTVTFEKIVRSTVPGTVGASAVDVIDVPWIAN